MRTKGKAIRDKIDDSISEINRLLTISYSEEDYAKLFKIVGGEIEKFLKSTIFQTNKNLNFFDLIENLKLFTIQQNHIDALHTFRETYNGYKHRPGFSKDINEGKVIFERIGEALDEINSKGIGGVNQSYVEKTKRIVWFAGWDDYIGGMTECDIFIPEYNVDFPIGLEHFNVSFEGWDAVIKKFTASGDLKMGKEFISERAYRVWSTNTDLIGVGTFNGDIGEFVRELAKNNSPREKELLSFLKRENDSTSVKAGIVFSLFDSLRQDSWTSVEDLRDEILLRASYDYGINIYSKLLETYIDKLNFKVIEHQRNLLKLTNDILWVDEMDYNKFKTDILSETLSISVEKNGNLVTRIK
jgi:hypothetical protein